jgi:hypothetical protein
MKRTLITIATLAFSSLYLGGCLLGPGPEDADGNTSKYQSTGAGYFEEEMAKAIATDIANIPQNCSGTSNSLAKSQADGSLSIQWQPWAYETNWWTRSGAINGTDVQGNTLSITSIDSVQYIISGQPIQIPLQIIGLTAKARRHNRIDIVVPASGTALLTSDYILEAGVAVEGSDTVLSISGTADGYILAQNADASSKLEINADATATGVKCKYVNGRWSVPYTGTVVVNTPYKKYDINYAEGTATIVVTGITVDSQPKTITINITVE